MHKTVTVNRSGMCPYCDCNCFTNGVKEERHVTQTKVQCTSCMKWSVRNHRNGAQYPLQDHSDRDSSPVTKVVYEE